MSVRKVAARLVAADGVVIGEGRAFLHLRLPESQPQSAQGTLALDWWSDASDVGLASLELIDGPSLTLELENDKLSACINGRVLRYKTSWPGAAFSSS